MKFVGSHFVQHLDNGDAYRTGRIVEAVTADMFLVEFDNMAGNAKKVPMEVVDASSFSDTFRVKKSRIPVWHFFKTEADRRAWFGE